MTEMFIYRVPESIQKCLEMLSYQYRKPSCGDKTMLWPSHIHSGIPYIGNTASLYWTKAQAIMRNPHEGTDNPRDEHHLCRRFGSMW